MSGSIQGSGNTAKTITDIAFFVCFFNLSGVYRPMGKTNIEELESRMWEGIGKERGTEGQNEQKKKRILEMLGIIPLSFFLHLRPCQHWGERR